MLFLKLVVLVNAAFAVVCRYFFCEKCFMCSHSEVMEVVDNPTRPPMYVYFMCEFSWKTG